MGRAKLFWSAGMLTGQSELRACMTTHLLHMTLQILHIGPTNVHVGPDSNSIPEAWLAWWQLDHVRTAKAVILLHVALPQGTAILLGKDSLRGTAKLSPSWSPA